jgi:hypothetical protein
MFQAIPNVAHKISVVNDEKNTMIVLNFVIIKRKLKKLKS